MSYIVKWVHYRKTNLLKFHIRKENDLNLWLTMMFGRRLLKIHDFTVDHQGYLLCFYIDCM